MRTDLSYQELAQEVARLEKVREGQIADIGRLKMGQELYQVLFDHAGVAIVIVDVKTRQAVASNRKAYEELGYTEKEYLRLSYEDYLLDSDEKKIKIFSTLMEKGAVTYTSRLMKKNGDIMEVIGSAVVIKVAGKLYSHMIRINITDLINAEKKLKKTEERYRNILDEIDEGYYEVDLQGNFTFCNDAATRMLGYSPQELVGMSFRQYMTKENARKAFAYYHNIFKTGESAGMMEYEIVRKNGTKATIETSVNLIRNEDGDIVGFRGISRDVTEKVKMDQALKESETLYRAIFEHAGFGMTLTDLRTGEIVKANKKACEDLGYTPEELIGKNSESYFTVSTGDLQGTVIKSLLKEGGWTGIAKLVTKKGSIKEILNSSVLVTIGGKKYSHAIRVDMSEQKRVEKALRESEARFRSIFETAADPIFLTDLENRKIIDVNPAVRRYLGYAKEALLGRTMNDITAVDAVADAEVMIENLRKHGKYFYESIHIDHKGKEIFVEISSRIIQQKGEEIILSYVRDITQRKKIEDELAKYRSRLEYLVKERTQKLAATQTELIKKERLATLGQLTATVSHELRNPLGVIQSSNFYLQQKIKALDDIIKKQLVRIDDQVEKCDAIVSDLLEFTRGGHVETTKAEIGEWLNPLLDRIFEKEQIQLVRRIPDDLPEVQHDPIKMHQVIENIMDNAIKAVYAKKEQLDMANLSYEPEICLTVEWTDDHAVIDITDNGVGMDQKTLSMVFEPLFTTRSRSKGLGLPIVKNIVTEHFGTISIKSELRGGTAVRIRLPINA